MPQMQDRPQNLFSAGQIEGRVVGVARWSGGLCFVYSRGSATKDRNRMGGMPLLARVRRERALRPSKTSFDQKNAV